MLIISDPHYGDFMAFTAANLADLEAAIVEKVTGKRVRSREAAGKTTEFADSSLEDMYKLRAIMKADIDAAASGGGFISKVSFKDAT